METKRPRIVVADDEPVVLMGFADLAEKCGGEVVGMAGDGEEAIDLIRSLRPDLMILDIDMPGADGLKVAETIQKEMDIPAIIVTGYRKPEYVERAGTAGVYAYLQKPVDEYAMRSAITITMAQFSKRKEAERAKDDAEQKQKEAEQKLKDRVVIERAKGLLMDQFGLTDEQAMKALQKKSKDTNTKLAVVARTLVEAGEKLL